MVNKAEKLKNYTLCVGNQKGKLKFSVCVWWREGDGVLYIFSLAGIGQNAGYPHPTFLVVHA